MYLYSVIPLVSLPRSFSHSVTYFSSEDIRVGCLVVVPLHTRDVYAVIIQRHNATEQKQAIRKSMYSLKRIKEIINSQPIVSKNTLLLAIHLSNYYYESLPRVLRYMLPASLLRKGEKNIDTPKEPDNHHKEIECNLVMGQATILQESALHLYPTSLHIPSALPSYTKRFLGLRKEAKLWLPPYCDRGSFVGTKRLAFLPVPPTTPLVFHNENNPSYNQQRRKPYIDTRVVGHIRSLVEGVPLCVYDTVPSLVTYHFFKQHRFPIVRKPHNVAPVSVVSLKRDTAIHLSLQNALRRLQPNDQAIVFTHRRGIANVIMCRMCGFLFQCKKCETPYILHPTTLLCHRCSDTRPIPTACMVCGAHYLKELGAGTAQIERMVQSILPHLTVRRIDSDVITTQKQRSVLFSDFVEKKYNILVGGTSIIHHHTLLPKVRLALVLNIDDMMNIPTYYASEQAFLTVWRLREKTYENVLLQTHLPHIPLIHYVQRTSPLPFLEYQFAFRKAIGAPPFSQEVFLLYKHTDSAVAQNNAFHLVRRLQKRLSKMQSKTISVIGPAPHYHRKHTGYFQWYIIVRCKKIKKPPFIKIKERDALLALVPETWDISIDPYTTS